MSSGGALIGPGAEERRRRTVIILAASGAAAAMLLTMGLLLAIKSKTAARAVNTVEQQTSTVVATTGDVTLLAPRGNIPRGTKLSDVTDWQNVSVNRNLVPTDAVRDSAELRSKWAKELLPAGEPIRLIMLTDSKPIDALEIGPGMRAISISVDETSGIEGHALPGTRVDVVLTFNQGGELTSKIIVQNSRVLSLGGETRAGDALIDKDRNSRAGTLTLEVAPTEMLTITQARQMGRVGLIMRAAGDNAPASVIEVTQSDFLEQPKPKVQQVPKQQNCGGGTIRIGGEEYEMMCDGSFQRKVNVAEP